MFIIKFPEQNSEDIYQQFVFLVEDVYEECIENGYTESGAAGKTKYELEPMAKDTFDKKILYLELSYSFAKKELKESFFDVYQKLKEVIGSKSVRQLPYELNLNDEYTRQVDVKVRKIIRFFEQNFQDRHFV